MYLISNKDGIIGLCDQPNYVKNKHGVYVECKEREAEGIAFNGTVYEISDIVAKRIDSGVIAFENARDIENNSSGLFDVADLADENSNGLFELADIVTSINERLSALEV